MKMSISTICLLALLFASHALNTSAQTFPMTIQGNLKDGSLPANAAYDIKCTFYNAATDGASLGSYNFPSVQVTNGVFAITLPSANTLFNYSSIETERWVEYSVKPAGSASAYTTLSPRQRVSYAPLALASFDSWALGGIGSTDYVKSWDPRMTDARNPVPGSASYIQNSTFPQTAEFNISGMGTAATLSAIQFNMGGNRMFWNGGQTDNLFAGYESANSNLGSTRNSFYGTATGKNNSTGGINSFFGWTAGEFNTSGTENSFFGAGSGRGNTTGGGNTFFGRFAGALNTTGNFNTALGWRADVSPGDLSNATAIGSNARVTQSNSLVLGSVAPNGADTNVGIGTTAPASRLHVNGTVRVTNGAVYITNPNTVIITSPNGACWGITVNNSGALSTFPVTPCP